MATNGSFTQQEQYNATSGAADSNASGNDLSKDEVGWYFVEQYYNTLSKSHEKLHLFYGKRSQFVSGLEAEITNVSVGRAAIQERIRHLNFQDCKVRISNVDSQASGDSIVIQVIGETSNKSAELKKFVQTFVLAQQPTGYFVLNDIFRYIKEEGEDEPVETAQEETAASGPLVEDVEMPKAQASTEDAAPAALDADVVDKKLETIEPQPAAEIPSTNGTSETVAEAEEAPVAAPTKVEEPVPTPEAAEKAVEETTIKEPEKPKEPVPSPAASKAAPASKPAEPAQPAAPPKPLSWASRAAAAVGSTPKPAVPAVIPKTATPPAQTRAAPPAAKPAAAQSTPAPVSAAEKNKENTASEWQTAGDNAKRQNRPQSISAPPEKEGTMAYIRNVTDKLSPEELRSALESFGPLIYFDINRTKNCAFVEYQTPEGYQAATSANPHQIAGESIYVEPRRPKANAYGGNGYSGGRGGANQRGRGGFQDRQGAPGGRGNFGGQNRGRGGAATPRGGRGAGQATPSA
ncbi:putative G3BP-like protein [Lachnellula suecica]|uniref:Putative G3BP-like protein n=1 Tax=Lachnellula suecica TaxID=602035 RepID=A0A8T9C262_9HELO|nr:putative G3BP-like protein [Lachnellula suecica]